MNSQDHNSKHRYRMLADSSSQRHSSNNNTKEPKILSPTVWKETHQRTSGNEQKEAPAQGSQKVTKMTEKFSSSN